jgi:GAF domain-containing protein
MTYTIDLVKNILRDPARLHVLRSLALLDTPTEVMFDRLTALAARALNASMSLITLIDADRQYFKSYYGLPDPWDKMRETPLSHSFCQHLVVTNDIMVVPDARRDPVLMDNMAIRDLDIISYLGIPLTTDDGMVLGAFCVLDHVARDWTEDEIMFMRELAATAITLIDLRGQLIVLHKVAEEKLQDAHQHLAQVRAQNASMRATYRGIVDDLGRRAVCSTSRDDLTLHIRMLPRDLSAPA